MKKLLLSMMVIIGFTAAAYAQPSVSVSPAAITSATIVGPRSVQKTGDLSFGTIVSGTAGLVVVGTADDLVSSVPTHLGGTITSARFKVTADDNTTFSISFPNASVILSEFNSGQTMVASLFTTSLPLDQGTIPVGGAPVEFLVGGTLDVVSATQAPGDYANNDLVTGLMVTVNFN